MSGLHILVEKIKLFVLNPVISLLMVAASMLFIWGVIQTWVLGGDDPEQVAQGKRHIVWGLFGLIVMVSVFGIMNLILSIFLP